MVGNPRGARYRVTKESSLFRPGLSFLFHCQRLVAGRVSQVAKNKGENRSADGARGPAELRRLNRQMGLGKLEGAAPPILWVVERWGKGQSPAQGGSS